MAESPIVIDAAKCVGCGKCVRGCGFGALKLVDKKAVVDPSACRACSACVKACPFHAVAEVRVRVNGTADIDSYRDIWVFAEQSHGTVAEVAFELLGKGVELRRSAATDADSAPCCSGAASRMT